MLPSDRFEVELMNPFFYCLDTACSEFVICQETLHSCRNLLGVGFVLNEDSTVADSFGDPLFLIRLLVLRRPALQYK